MTVRSHATAPVQLVLHAPTGYVRGRCVARDYFSPVSSNDKITWNVFDTTFA